MKVFKKALRKLASPFAVGIVVTCAITYMSFFYYAARSNLSSKDDHSLISAFQQLHQKTIDWRLIDRGQLPGSSRVAILAIDERAVQQEGRFPWPRDKMAQVVERALGLGAKSISFDIIYSEPDETSAIPTLRRLKRTLAAQSHLTPEITPLLDQELSHVDGDQAFAKTVKEHADHLILGSFFDAEEPASAFQDFCLDALFERSRESRYWQHEALPLTVIDASLNKLGFPKQIKEQLALYFTTIESTSSREWFDKHPTIAPKITEHLDELASVLPVELYPGVATLWLNDDVDLMRGALEQLQRPELATPEGVRQVFGRFGAAFTKKEAASLTEDVKSEGSAYCKRFFTENDELLNLDRYKAKWGAKPEDIKDFNETMSWQSVWSKIQSERVPAQAGNTTAEPARVSADGLLETIEQIRQNALPNSILNTDSWLVNIPIIGDYTKHTGYFNAKLDSDGTVRRSFLMVRRGNSYMPSLALKQFLVDKGLTAIAKIDSETVGRKEATTKIIQSLELVDAQGNTAMQVPVDGHGYLLINYAGAREMFPHVSAADILSDTEEMVIEQRQINPSSGQWELLPKSVNKKEFLKDKLLIAGATATGIFDLRVTPFEENYPGVETHANVLSNLLTEYDRQTQREPASVAKSSFKAAPGFLHAHPREEHTMWIFLIALGLTLSALLTYFGSMAGLGITGVALGGVYAVDKYYFFSSGIVTTVLFPIFEISATFVSLTFYKYFTEERKKRELKGTFEKYVSPSIVAEVLSDPENIELGGKKMELTVMFSDVRGFTTISEKLDPRQLSDLLNSYLTPMTDLVFKNKGTLDKYMGDAIMAFWGAPIHFKDHAKHAARCALQMIVKLRELQAEYKAKGLPNIDIGIGLNTGDMSVGNMGSETVRSYTVMGDSVNLGSRLEGINKEYGTRIIVSEFTQREIQDSFVTREVDWVRVKGKLQPVRIFELICEGKAPEQKNQLLQHFNAGFQLYHERKFTEAVTCFQEALKVDADDPVTQLYLERCEDYLKEPPPENWDGVFTMTSK